MFEEALKKVLDSLEAARAQGLLSEYVLIGGFAVAAWGVPRATQDIDFAVAIGSNNPSHLATFMDGRYESGGVDDPLKGVIFATIPVGSGSVPLQLIFLPSSFTEAIFRQVETLLVMDHRVPVVKWEMLVVLKLYAGGPQNILDARQILKVRQPSRTELQAVGTLATKLGVHEEWATLSAGLLKNHK